MEDQFILDQFMKELSIQIARQLTNNWTLTQVFTEDFEIDEKGFSDFEILENDKIVLTINPEIRKTITNYLPVIIDIAEGK